MADDDWKEIENHNEDYSDSNGWCGRCRDHAEWLHKLDEWGDNE